MSFRNDLRQAVSDPTVSNINFVYRNDIFLIFGCEKCMLGKYAEKSGCKDCLLYLTHLIHKKEI